MILQKPFNPKGLSSMRMSMCNGEVTVPYAGPKRPVRVLSNTSDMTPFRVGSERVIRLHLLHALTPIRTLPNQQPFSGSTMLRLRFRAYDLKKRTTKQKKQMISQRRRYVWQGEKAGVPSPPPLFEYLISQSDGKSTATPAGTPAWVPSLPFTRLDSMAVEEVEVSFLFFPCCFFP
eukprot:gene11375-7881_t